MKSNEVIVSVIIPIYNVAPFLERCLESAIHQSYTYLDIILIDDGSTDSSGEIADIYAQKDNRIRVFHRKNEGVSKARNYGLDNSIGEFVVFIDSDDFISSYFVEYLLRVLQESNAEFVYCKYVASSETELDEGSSAIRYLSPEQATCSFLYPGVVIGCWNKMFRKDYLDNNSIRFSSNFYMGEGLNFITKASQLASKVAVISKKLYFYRTDNIESATKKFNINKFENAIAAIENIKENLVLQTPVIYKAINFHYWWTLFYALQSIISLKENKSYKVNIDRYSKQLKSNALDMLQSEISFSMKIKVLCIKVSPVFFAKIVDFIKKNRK